LEEQHRETMQSIIFGMVEARLATDGWTEEEVELAWRIAEGWGMIDEATLTAVTSANTSISKYEDGVLSVSGVMNELTAAVDVGMGSVDESAVRLDNGAAMADHYSDRLGAIQPSISTEILQPFMEDAQAAIGLLFGGYDTVQDSVTTDIQQTNMIGARGQVRAYTGELNSIPRNVNTTLTTRRVTTSEGYVLPVSPIGGASGNAAGLDYVPRDGPALVHMGEAILPADEAAAYRGGGMGGTWNGNLYIDGSGDPQATAAAVMQQLQDRGIFSRAALR